MQKPSNITLFLSIVLLLGLGCSQQKGSGTLEAELLSNSRMVLRNGAGRSILVPLFPSQLVPSSQSAYRVDGCKVVDVREVKVNELWFPTMDTLHAGDVRSYDLDLFDYSSAHLYDSTLLHTFTLYDLMAHQEDPHGNTSDALIALAVISFRNKQGELNMSKVYVFSPSTSSLEALSLSICDGKKWIQNR